MYRAIQNESYLLPIRHLISSLQAVREFHVKIVLRSEDSPFTHKYTLILNPKLIMLNIENILQS